MKSGHGVKKDPGFSGRIVALEVCTSGERMGGASERQGYFTAFTISFFVFLEIRFAFIAFSALNRASAA